MTQQTKYIVYDVESVPDGALLGRTLYPGEDLSPDEAIARFCQEECRDGDPAKVFIPVTFHVPVSIAVARVDPNFSLIDMTCLDAPRFDPESMVRLFWKGLEHYRDARLVDFNGRGFDLPLLTMCAFRFGISCSRYFDDDRFGFRYRFTEKHLDLQEWISEYGAFRMRGGLNLLAKILGKPGKMGTTGASVAEMFARGEIQEINDYCLHDVLDTYFVFLRTRVMTGELPLDREQELVDAMRSYIETRSAEVPALVQYLENFGRWSATPFV